MTDTTARVNAKGCEGTGLTEDLASELFHQVGKHMMAIVELQVTDKHGPNLKDKRGVSLSITQLWPAEDTTLEDHLRELTRVLHQNNAVVGADGTRQQILLEEHDGPEPTVEGVIAANPGLKYHDYVSSMLAVDDTEAGPVCDVCGKTETDAIHHPPTLDPFAVDQPDDEADDEEADDERNELDEVHGFDQGPDDLCICGRPFEDELHPDSDPDEDEPAAEDQEPEDQPEPPTEFDETPTAFVLRRIAHVHVAGQCVKNRDGVPCDAELAAEEPANA